MDRLTQRNETGTAVLKVPYECGDCGHVIYRLCDTGNGEPVNRLAHYEETGFTPVQIRQIYYALAKAVYPHNKRFMKYVDRYAIEHKITIAEALTHEQVRQTCLMYVGAD